MQSTVFRFDHHLVEYRHGLPGSSMELDLGGVREDVRSSETPSHLMGFSLGAFQAIQRYNARPDRYDRLLLASPAAPLELGDFLGDMDGGSVVKLARDHPAVFRGMTRFQAAAVRAVPSRVLGAMFKQAAQSERSLLDDPVAKNVLIEGLRHSFGKDRSTYIRTVEAYVAPWAHQLRSIDVPVSVVYGAEDSWTPPLMVEALIDTLPNVVKVTKLASAGHYGALKACLQKPELLSAP